jgi:hypothetical protein
MDRAQGGFSFRAVPGAGAINPAPLTEIAAYFQRLKGRKAFFLRLVIHSHSQ